MVDTKVSQLAPSGTPVWSIRGVVVTIGVVVHATHPHRDLPGEKSHRDKIARNSLQTNSGNDQTRAGNWQFSQEIQGGMLAFERRL
jgi:hypothetical protein